MKPKKRTGKNTFHINSASTEDVVAALMGLYSRQTLEESLGHSTVENNGIGFNSFDASILTSLCEQISTNNFISEKQLTLVRSKLRKYRRQIMSLNLEDYRVPNLEVCDVYNKKQNKKTKKGMSCVPFGSDCLRLDFDYDKKLFMKIKCLSKRRYHAKGTERFWTCPINAKNVRMLTSMGFKIPPEIQAEVDKNKREISFLGLKKQLRPYQASGVARIAGELNLRALLADEMGLGKTAQALAAIHVRREETLPALVICPSSLKWNWAREAKEWIPDVTIRVLDGFSKRRSYKPKNNEIAIINYDILADRVLKNKKTKIGWAKILQKAGHKTIILDECHKIKNEKSKRSDAVRHLSSDKKNVIAISGTPIENKPAEFYFILSILDSTLFPNWWSYAHQYCGAKHNGYGWDFTGSSNAELFHEILTENIMIRRLKKDVLKELPTKIRSVIPVEIDMVQYQKEEYELRSYLARMQNREIPANRKNAEGLARIERMKQAAVIGKMDAAKEWIENFLDTDKKLVVFATHSFVLQELQKYFGKSCVLVDGATATRDRIVAVDNFQTNDKVRLFLGNIKAAGVGLTLTAASDTLTLELGWNPGLHDQAEDRVHRMGQEADSVTAYYLIARNTIEEQIISLLDEKRIVLEQVLDGKEASEVSLLQTLLSKYMEGRS